MSITDKIADFETQHKLYFETALSEIKQGHKQSHWMWYIFPQISGLGTSPNATHYAICSCEEAKAFVEHPILGNNLRKISKALLDLQGNDATQVLGKVDALKLRSSMTLFDALCPNDIFEKVLDKYHKGERDRLTLCRLSLNSRVQDALKFIGIDAKDFNITPGMYNTQRERPTHRFSHIYRVMIGTALIAHKRGQARLGLLAFIAAFIHDLARHNDGNDPKHGRRAAETKLPKITHILSKYNITPQEYDMIAKAATFHCEVITERLSEDCYIVCKMLSDADALDRCRFKTESARLNPKMLKLAESHSCIVPIDFVCKESVRLGKINTEIPFIEFIKVAEF